jgi:hypothetical protein
MSWFLLIDNQLKQVDDKSLDHNLSFTLLLLVDIYSIQTSLNFKPSSSGIKWGGTIWTFLTSDKL